MVHKLCINEEYWSKIDFLLKFTSPAFELLWSVDIDKPFLGEVYDGMDTMVEKIVENITQDTPTLIFVNVDFAKNGKGNHKKKG